MEKKRVLVVDDDEAMRIALRKLLVEEGYEVVDVDGAKSAQNLISLERFDLVISDIRMPEMNGIELLLFIKRTKPIPVILITGFSELTETQEAYTLGADEFIPKPFKREELLEAVNLCCNAGSALAGQESQDDQYCKLSLDDFVSGKNMQCAIFLRLSETKYVKVAHEGENLPLDRIRMYKSKNVRFLYMLKKDFRKYVGFTLNLAKVVKVSNVAKIKKLNFIKHTGEVILEQLYSNELDKEGFENAKNLIETTVSVISDDQDIFNLLNILNSHTDFLYAHSLGVSLYSLMIADVLRWTSPMNKFKIGVGGLLHDIGKKEIDRTILLKERKDYTPEDARLIESHPSRGRDILSEIKSIPSDVIEIALQHHEGCDGLGYPSGLKLKNIHPLARLICVANEFCGLALKNPHRDGMPPQEAILRMNSVRADMFDKDCFTALCKLFHVELPKVVT